MPQHSCSMKSSFEAMKQAISSKAAQPAPETDVLRLIRLSIPHSPSATEAIRTLVAYTLCYRLNIPLSTKLKALQKVNSRDWSLLQTMLHNGGDRRAGELKLITAIGWVSRDLNVPMAVIEDVIRSCPNTKVADICLRRITGPYLALNKAKSPCGQWGTAMRIAEDVVKPIDEILSSQLVRALRRRIDKLVKDRIPSDLHEHFLGGSALPRRSYDAVSLSMSHDSTLSPVPERYSGGMEPLLECSTPRLHRPRRTRDCRFDKSEFQTCSHSRNFDTAEQMQDKLRKYRTTVKWKGDPRRPAEDITKETSSNLVHLIRARRRGAYNPIPQSPSDIALPGLRTKKARRTRRVLVKFKTSLPNPPQKKSSRIACLIPAKYRSR